MGRFLTGSLRRSTTCNVSGLGGSVSMYRGSIVGWGASTLSKSPAHGNRKSNEQVGLKFGRIVQHRQ